MDGSRSISWRQFLKVSAGGFGLGGAVALGMNLGPIAAHPRTLKIAGARRWVGRRQRQQAGQGRAQEQGL